MRLPWQRLPYTCGLLVIAFTAYIIYAADRDTMPTFISQLYNFHGGDKVGHVVLLGILAFSVNYLLYPRRIRLFDKRIPTGAILVTLFVTLEEISQIFIANRSFDLLDLACSYLGITFGTIGLMLWKKRESKRKNG